MQWKEQSRKDMWDTAKKTNINVIGDSERKEREIGAEAKFVEIMAEIFPNW